jgi:uncharacterized protein YuzE
MREFYLEVTFRHGRPIAAYLYLPRCPHERSYRSLRVEPGLVIDFNRTGEPIGIEITTPSKLTLANLNKVLKDLGLPTVKSTYLAPLLPAKAA